MDLMNRLARTIGRLPPASSTEREPREAIEKPITATFRLPNFRTRGQRIAMPKPMGA